MSRAPEGQQQDEGMYRIVVAVYYGSNRFRMKTKSSKLFKSATLCHGTKNTPTCSRNSKATRKIKIPRASKL